MVLITRTRIILDDFMLPVSIGIHDFERTGPQRIIVHVELDVTSPETERDAIDDVVDYDFLRNGIRELVDAGHYNLQETLCGQIVELCLTKPSVLRATVSTRKPDVYADCRSVGVEMTGERDSD